LRRELSFFTLDDRTRLKTVEGAISELESALADGRHEEMRRIEKLGELWTFELPDDTRQKTEISVKIENAVKTRYHLDKLWEVRGLSQDHQAEACSMAVNILTRQLNQEPIAEDVLKKTHEKAIEALSVRESWLYRDLQAAVGDLMLSEIPSERRRFEVKGYAAFLELTKNATPEKQWTDRLYEIFHELDISQPDNSDARALQLEKTLVATAKLLRALAEVKQRAGSVSDETLTAAGEVINDYDNR
jgi:hypothetical protein